MWRYGYPKSLDWDGNVGSWTEGEGTSSSEQCEHNVGSFALNLLVQDQASEKWELARAALGCHIALDMLYQEMHEAWYLAVAAQRPFITRRKVEQVFVDRAGLLVSFFFSKFLSQCEHLVPRAFLSCENSSPGRKEAGPRFGRDLVTSGRSGSFFFSCVHRFFQATDALALDTTSPAS